MEKNIKVSLENMVIKYTDLKVSYLPYDDTDLLVLEEKNEWVISINSNISENKKRLLLAKGIKYYNDKISRIEALGRKPKEAIKAEKFARNLLLPKKIFSKAYNSKGVKELSEIFGVEKNIIRERAKELNLKKEDSIIRLILKNLLGLSKAV